MLKPAAIITSLEDSPSWLDQRLVSAYLSTLYFVTEPRFEIRIGEMNPYFDAWLGHSGAQSFFFITAWNPLSTILPHAENEMQNSALHASLQIHCRYVFPGYSLSAAGDWPPEESFLALDLPVETALSLARQFGQNAIVFGRHGGKAELWWAQ